MMELLSRWFIRDRDNVTDPGSAGPMASCAALWASG